jgi:hypothetical protein
MNSFIFTIIILFRVTCLAQAKGSILKLTTSPINPTTTDSTTFFVDFSFTSGNCQLDQSGISITALTVMASSLYCVGLLTVIYNRVDTFKIGPQSAGSYPFDITLSTGIGVVPCSPEIIPDDDDTRFQFTVSTAKNIVSTKNTSIFRLYPKPVK